MGVGNALIGVGATLLSKMLELKAWSLLNNKTNEMIKGQFPAEDVTRNIGANWTEIQALNRQNSFLQFLNGKTDTLTVASRYYKKDLLDDSPVDKIEKLAEWTRMSRDQRRPPLLTFFLGDGLGLQVDVILDSLSNIKYSQPNALGGIREVSFTMNFLRWSRSQMIADQLEVTDTRYHHAREGDYYEFLAFQEYGDPMIGVVLRQRHPDQPIVHAGDIVKLPALEGVRGSVPTQQSNTLKTAYGRKDTSQRRLRIFWFSLRSKPGNVFFFTPAKRIA